jgi:hypothetical protein
VGEEGVKAGLAGALLLISLAACTSPAAQACKAIRAQPAVMATVFFGRAVPNRSDVTDAEWDWFAREQLTPRFPDGFTVTDGAGQWRDPITGRIATERTKIVLIAADPGSGFAARLKGLAAAYQAAFHQESVGIVLTDGCDAF